MPNQMSEIRQVGTVGKKKSEAGPGLLAYQHQGLEMQTCIQPLIF